MKKTPLLSLMLVSLCLAAWTAYAQAQRSGSRGQTWEYRVVRIPTYPNSNMTSPEDAQRVLNELGADGWELVTAGGNFYVKRAR
jgi:hypothetical protein